MTDEVEVTQADRKAAAALAREIGEPEIAEKILEGVRDPYCWVQAFARHRQASTDPLMGEGWQPIETAPDEGWFLCRWFAADNSGQCEWRIVQARKEPTLRSRGYFETWDNRLFQDPSHWMPCTALLAKIEEPKG